MATRPTSQSAGLLADVHSAPCRPVIAAFRELWQRWLDYLLPRDPIAGGEPAPSTPAAAPGPGRCS